MALSETRFSSSSPRYHQVRLALRQRIKDGDYAGAFPMPGERELAREFGVGRVTVRAALAQLEAEGLVIRLRGKGTLPVQYPEAPGLPLRGGLLEYLLSMGLRTQAQVLEYRGCAAAPEVARRLGLEPATRVLKVVRIRKFEGHAISHSEAYVPYELAPQLPRRALREAQMVTLLEQQGIKVVSAEQTLSAAIAEPDVAKALGVPEGLPLLKVTRVVTDETGRPIQFYVGLYHPDRYEYHMRLSRVRGETNVWVESEGNRPMNGVPT